MKDLVKRLSTTPIFFFLVNAHQLKLLWNSILWESFSSAVTGKLIRSDRKMDKIQYGAILKENQLGARDTMEWFRSNHLCVLEGGSQSSELQPTQTLTAPNSKLPLQTFLLV
uniref:Uncharacterized protein n=1 Tax=Xiphophorus couchianus TaxID=32473 RepID=A0A3B5MF53_9TELE